MDLKNAILLVDKPSGLTSFETVSAVKRILRVRKIGHSGTLDKFASGLLVICTGWCTRLTRFFLDSDKRYEGVIRLGVSTDTDDREGDVINRNDVIPVGPEDIAMLEEQFSGVIRQKPPRFSALKIKGKRASDRVRAGEEVIIKEREVNVYRLGLEVLQGDTGALAADVHCSKGTYIRSLARDIGERLGCGAHLEELRRTASGIFSVADAATLDELQYFADGGGFRKSCVRDPADSFPLFGRITVDSQGSARVMNGAVFREEEVVDITRGNDDYYLILDEKKILIAIVCADIQKWHIQYINVFNAVSG